MSKNHRPASPNKPTLVAVTDPQGDVLINPSERARKRAVTTQHEQREDRARREAQQIIAAAERLTATPAPTTPDLRNLEIWTPKAPPLSRIAATLFIALAAFIAGLTVGRL